MSKICGIYEILNTVNGKKYIGQSINIHKRYKGHISKLNQNTHHNQYLQNSWNKYGKENFTFNIIEQCDIDDLDELEKFYISYYKTCDRRYGYNIDDGGNSNKCLSDETRRKISESHKKENLSDETKRKMSESAKKRCATQEWIDFHHNVVSGRSVSDDTKLKMSKSHMGHKHSDSTREKIRKSNMGDPVLCVELNIVFDCAKDACVSLGIGDTMSGSILQCCRGKRKTCGGYSWDFA